MQPGGKNQSLNQYQYSPKFSEIISEMTTQIRLTVEDQSELGSALLYAILFTSFKGIFQWFRYFCDYCKILGVQ